MKTIELPGIVYSLLLAVGAWAIDYFSTGDGSGIPWAPIMVAAVPILLKSFTVAVRGKIESPSLEGEPVGSARGMATFETEQVAEGKSKLDSWLWG